LNLGLRGFEGIDFEFFHQIGAGLNRRHRREKFDPWH
jgi:hypothetical protein